MSTSPSSEIQNWLDRLRQGDLAARDELLQFVGKRLYRLARKMLRKFSRLKRWEDTDDVLQNAMLRLCRALEAVAPASAREFFSLATLQIRRELLDLTRHYFGPQGWAANHESPAQWKSSGRVPVPAELPESTQDPGRLDKWTDFHQQVELLPAEENEVFCLFWYHGLTRGQTAQILEVDERTVRRRLLRAKQKLSRALKREDW
jgi:RNA polymerase sigma factor (sigma-70 family)